MLGRQVNLLFESLLHGIQGEQLQIQTNACTRRNVNYIAYRNSVSQATESNFSLEAKQLVVVSERCKIIKGRGEGRKRLTTRHINQSQYFKVDSIDLNNRMHKTFTKYHKIRKFKTKK